MMSEDNLMCECGWIGHRNELVSTDEEPDLFLHCPDCEQSDGLECEDDGSEESAD